jgi:hypothetical protein
MSSAMKSVRLILLPIVSTLSLLGQGACGRSCPETIKCDRPGHRGYLMTIASTGNGTATYEHNWEPGLPRDAQLCRVRLECQAPSDNHDN